MTQTIPINEILVEDRQRLDLGDLSDLCASIKAHGLLQPLVINQDKRLIAGGRRLAALNLLGCREAPFVLRETLSSSELHILELEENIRRKDMSWQEKALTIFTIHSLVSAKAYAEGQTWSYEKTSSMMQLVKSVISENILIARLLKEELDEAKQVKPDARFFACESLSDAIRLLLRDKEEQGLALLRSQPPSPTLLEEEVQLLHEVEQAITSPDALAEARARYASNPLNTIPFDQYWAEKQAMAVDLRNTIYLSNRLFLGDAITFMLENPGRFDHVITDIPYGIDMAMLNQQNPHGSITDIDKVEALHDVEYNRTLIAAFFPAAFATMRPQGFCITWGDQMLWQYMYDNAVAAGFSVQRWPITWVKNSAMNQCVAYNTTKDTEIAIVCRKKGTTMAFQPGTSVISCGHDELSNSITHPFAKPFAVWEFLIRLASIESQSVLDPFAGGGSGTISMLRMNRNAFAVELDPTHFNSLTENVKQHFLSQNPNATFK